MISRVDSLAAPGHSAFNSTTSKNLSAAGDIGSYSGDPDFMTSLARGLAVMQAFSNRTQQISISQLSIQTGIPRAAVRRCLYTLCKLGFVGENENRRFFLRPRVLTLGQGYIQSNLLASTSQPILEHLSGLLHESCSVASLDGDSIIYVARSSVTRIMSVDLRVGTRLPAFCTSMGRVLLANLPTEQLEALLKQVRLTSYTARTVSSVDRLRQILHTVKRNGYALVDQELEIGLRSMAVPVCNGLGQVIGGLNVGAHAQRATVREMQSRFLPHLREAAQEISVLLQ